MPSLPSFLEFLPECKVILCKTHGLCLRQPQVGPHLQSKHQITEKDYDDVIQAMSDLEIAVKTGDVCLPAAGSLPIDGLPILDGFECCATKECPYLTANPNGLQPHLSRHHSGIEKIKKKVGYHNKVKLQRFFPDSNFAGYFIVDPECSMPGSPQFSSIVIRQSTHLSSSNKKRLEVIDMEEEEATEDGVGNPRFNNSIIDQKSGTWPQIYPQSRLHTPNSMVETSKFSN